MMSSFDFTDNEKRELIQLAKDSIKTSFSGSKLAISDLKKNPKFSQKAAAFVTLHKNGKLRGCIGQVIARDVLLDTVINMAKAAAFEDPRFPRLQESEVGQLEFEISVLTPMQEIKSVDEIKVGKHGIMIRRGNSSGLFLPQVATEQGWDRNQLLKGVCQKAGLPVDAWENNAEIFIFSAEVFGE